MCSKLNQLYSLVQDILDKARKLEMWKILHERIQISVKHFYEKLFNYEVAPSLGDVHHYVMDTQHHVTDM